MGHRVAGAGALQMPVRTNKRKKLEVSPMGPPEVPTRTGRHVMGSTGSLLLLSAACRCQSNLKAVLCLKLTAHVTARTRFFQALPVLLLCCWVGKPIIDSPSTPSICKVLDE